MKNLWRLFSVHTAHLSTESKRFARFLKWFVDVRIHKAGYRTWFFSLHYSSIFILYFSSIFSILQKNKIASEDVRASVIQIINATSSVPLYHTEMRHRAIRQCFWINNLLTQFIKLFSRGFKIFLQPLPGSGEYWWNKKVCFFLSFEHKFKNHSNIFWK